MSWFDDFIENTGNMWDDITGAVTGRTSREASEEAGRDIATTQERAEALSLERYGTARELLDPYIGEARTAREQYMIEMGLAPGEAGTAYMETPGYQALLDERQAAAEQTASETGGLYSGRRIKAASDIGGATQSQFYQNYMGMLRNLGDPSIAANVAGMGVSQASDIGRQQLTAQQIRSGYDIAGAGATQSAIGDILGMGANIYGGYLAGGGGGTPSYDPSFGSPYYDPSRTASEFI